MPTTTRNLPAAWPAAVPQRLGPHCVDVWAANVWDLGADATPLSLEERARIRDLVPAARDRFVAGRRLLRHILGAYLEVEGSAVSLRVEEGRPVLTGRWVDVDLTFSLSHSEGLVVAAFARNRRVGVDVEALRPIPFGRTVHGRVVGDHPVPLDDADRDERVLVHWTRHEAAAKAYGRGLDAVLGQPDRDDALGLHRLAPAPGFIGHLAVAGTAPTLRCRSLG